MARGRKPNPVATVPKQLHLSETLIDRVNAIIRDPFTGKPAHGKWSEIAESLFTEWANKREQQKEKGTRTINLDDIEF